jgi:diketogulonate reductase-like aldo/keto reductase
MAAGAVTQDGRARVLTDGNEIPLLGLGVWQVPDGPECENAVRWALEAGYRHIDTAQARRGLLEGCDERGLVIEAYSPLGTGRRLGDDRVAQIADRVGRIPAQVLISWCLQRDLVVLPKSSHRERIEENGQIFDFTLTDDDMAALDELDKTGGTDRARGSKWW